MSTIQAIELMSTLQAVEDRPQLMSTLQAIEDMKYEIVKYWD